jgi:diguanylate cyclase (GGDEF)-like protein/PAS domain S-box-containing protein
VEDEPVVEATPYARMHDVAGRLLSPVAVIGPDSTLRYVNAAAAHAVGVEPDELLGRRMIELVHPKDRVRIRRELRMVAQGTPSGGSTRYELRASPVQGWRTFESIAHNFLDDAEIQGILVSSRDVTDQVAYERKLRDSAQRDPLTRLANRATIAEELEVLVRKRAPLAVCFFGLDRFKLINDSLGHTAGDTVLQSVAARVASSVPAGTTLGRFAGDLLVLIVTGPAAREAHALAWRVIERVGEPMFLAGHELRLSMSAGVAELDATATGDSLLRDADLAMQRAKAEGGGRAERARREFREAAASRLELEADLRRAIVRSEFAVALQPIVSLADGAAVGAEALVRWRRAGQLVEPCSFIPAAESTGLIVPIGDWIISRSAALAASAPGGHVRVNLSPRQLSSPGLVDRIRRALAAARIPATSIGFEVTETLLMEDLDFAIGVLSELRSLGCRVGLDDFGTGYSSLGYLRRLPIDFLKIDGSLTADIDANLQARAVLGAILAMADALALEVIAEGIETEPQAAALAELGCGFAQGYLFGRPVITG